ncbi:MAG: nucleotidyltransferase family protein [Mariprofundaceae bacterium]|nr:nucleotidyltransferase family protein [Mariprofundaceae bacterium]
MQRVERAVILAAGLGTRLKWLTCKRPKALVPVAGQAAVVRVIRRLAGQGIRDIAINTHHHADVLAASLGDGSRFGVRLYFSFETQLLDSGGGVRTALEFLPGDGLLAVHNVDVLSDIDVHALAGVCPQHGCTIALTANPAHHPAGDFTLCDGLVCDEKASRYTFSGVSVWDATVLSDFAINQAFSLVQPMRELIEKQLCAGLLHRGSWFDIGRPGDYFRAGRELRRIE